MRRGIRGRGTRALCELGYRAVGRSQGRHLPPMIRETSWEWRGDYYASDLPIPVEVHYQLWDEQAESIPVPGERLFWDRRSTLSVEGRTLPVLSEPDRLAFASLHLLMHLLHGDLRLQRAWEIAHFLHTHARDGAFWSLWQGCHEGPLRRLEAIVFQLVSVWFGADLGPEAEHEIDQLPGDVKLWMKRYAWSPVEALFQPNKDEIWLHLSLVDSLRDKCSIFLRRVLPLRVPERVDEGTLRNEPPTPTQLKRHLLYLGSRTLHHARALLPSLYSGARWYWIRNEFSGDFLRYLAASGLFSFGVSIFFLLYNLYLLNLGYREDLLGRVSGCMSLGTVLGALPAAFITRRAGLRKALLIAILGSAVATLSRTLGAQEAWLLATAFLNGLFLSLWAISFSPAVAGLTNERNRQSAFGLACSFGVCAGVLGGLAGGRLPGLLGSLLHLAGPVSANRAALMVASASRRDGSLARRAPAVPTRAGGRVKGLSSQPVHDRISDSPLLLEPGGGRLQPFLQRLLRSASADERGAHRPRPFLLPNLTSAGDALGAGGSEEAGAGERHRYYAARNRLGPGLSGDQPECGVRRRSVPRLHVLSVHE